MRKKHLYVLMVLLALCTGAQAATISANPYHVSLNPTETTNSSISWSGTSGTVDVFVSVNNGADQLIYSGSGSGPIDYSGIQTPNWYVFKLKQSGSQLAWTAVTTQWKPDFQFGYNTLPGHADWFITYNKHQAPMLYQDLVMACSFNGCTIRFNNWGNGTHLDSHQSGKYRWVFDPGFYQLVDNMVNWLAGPCYDNNVRVVMAFHNENFTGGHYAHDANMTLQEIKERTVDWMTVIINAIEADPKARMVVFGYDYQNEVWRYTSNIVSYMQYIVDNVPVPLGKRVLSISFKKDGNNSDYITWWAQQLSSRRFDYVDLHFYPDAQKDYDQPGQLAGWVTKARTAYPNATVYMGEYGMTGGGSFPDTECTFATKWGQSKYWCEDEQSGKMRDLAVSAKSSSLMAHMAWEMVAPGINSDPEPLYGMTYNAYKPKDVIGTFADPAGYDTGSNNLSNGDMESPGTPPPGWTGNSNISYTFTRQGPDGPNAATNDYFGRMSIGSGNSSDWVTIDSSALTITPLASVNYNLYLNGYVRTNMRFKVSIREFDAGSALIREQDWPHYLATITPANTWRSLVHLFPLDDPWIPSLHPNTRSVKIRFTGYGNGSNPSTLDIDAVSASIRAADHVTFASADFNHDGAVNIGDLAMFATSWLDEGSPSYLNSLAHRYTFDGNCNDSIGAAHASLVASDSSFYEWGPGYLWLKNGENQKNNFSNGGAYVDLPDYILDGMRNDDGVTLEMFFTTTQEHWWSGYLTFGAGNLADGTDDLLAVTSRENEQSIALWHQDAGYWGHRISSPIGKKLATACQIAIVVNHNTVPESVSYYIDGQLAGSWLAEDPVTHELKPWEMPGLKSSNETYHDTMNFLGRFCPAADNAMLNAKIYAFNMYTHALTAAEVAQSYANGADQLCTIVDEDLNGDCRVDMEDFALFAQQWLQ